MTETKKNISVAESKVMEALWRAHPLGADEIVEKIADEQSWSMGTVKTLLNRLLSKEAISAERDGRKYLYSPTLTREEYMNTESKGLLDRLFDGRVSSLVAHFSKHEKLDAKDIADIKKMIEDMEHDA